MLTSPFPLQRFLRPLLYHRSTISSVIIIDYQFGLCWHAVDSLCISFLAYVLVIPSAVAQIPRWTLLLGLSWTCNPWIFVGCHGFCFSVHSSDFSPSWLWQSSLGFALWSLVLRNLSLSYLGIPPQTNTSQVSISSLGSLQLHAHLHQSTCIRCWHLSSNEIFDHLNPVAFLVWLCLIFLIWDR